MKLPPVRFVTAPDGVQLAYTTYGSGPPIIWVAHWLTHLEMDWESPVWKHVVEFLAREHTVVRYDERGCGLSDWTEEGFDLDTWIADLETIVAALGLDDFYLLGISQGGPIAIEYAVRHPDKVRHLFLLGTFATGSFIPEDYRHTLGSLMSTGWGRSNPAFRQFFTSLFIPDADEEQRDWFNELQRRSTRPEIAAKLFASFGSLDVEKRLSQVKAPTLVLHSRNDAAIPFAAGRAVAAGIPNARLVPLDSDNHLPLSSGPGWEAFCREISACLQIPERSVEPDEDTSAQAPAASDRAGHGPEPDTVYRFGRCRLDSKLRELRRDGALVGVEHKVFDLLAYLIEHRDRAISKDELQNAVWPRMILTESALTRCIMKARRAVGDSPQRQDIIKTVHGHGYRFVGTLER